MATSARLDELKRKFDDNPRRYFAPLANEYRKQGDRAQAIALCRTHLPNQPGHISGHIVLAQALYESSELVESRHAFEQALDLDPENLIALRYLGDIAREEGAPSIALAWYQRVLDADPRNEEIAGLLRDVGAEAASAIAELASRPTPPTTPTIAAVGSTFSAEASATPQPPVLSYASMNLEVAEAISDTPAAPAEEDAADTPAESETEAPHALEFEGDVAQAAAPTPSEPPTAAPAFELDLPESTESQYPREATSAAWGDDPFLQADASPGELEAVAEPPVDDWFGAPASETPIQASAAETLLPDLSDADALPQYRAPEPEPTFEDFTVSWDASPSAADSDAPSVAPESEPSLVIEEFPVSSEAGGPADSEFVVEPLEQASPEHEDLSAGFVMESFEAPASSLAPSEADESLYDWVTDASWPPDGADEAGAANDALTLQDEWAPVAPLQDDALVAGAAEAPPEAEAPPAEVFLEASLQPEPASLSSDLYPWEAMDDAAAQPVEAMAAGADPMEEIDEVPAPDPMVGRTPLFNEAVPEPSAPFVTETMAELYLQQGFNEEALAIYRQLLSQSPDDEVLQQRVSALERGGESAVVPMDAAPTPNESQSVRAFFARFATRGRRAFPGREAPDAKEGDTFRAGTSGVATSDEAMTRPDVSSATLTQVFAAQTVSSADARAAASLASAFGVDGGLGAPAAEGGGELSLGRLFRDVEAHSADAVTTAGYASGSTPTTPGETSGAEVESHADVEQFTAWLEGLKKK